MSESTELQLANLGPMEMIQAAFKSAIDNKQGLEVVDRILEQQKWMIQHQEEETFNLALRRIQDQLKPVQKRGWNDSTKSHFALPQDVDAAIENLMRAERMALSFEPESHPLPNMVRIVGVLSLGAYSRRYPLDMPADGQGAKGGGVMTRTHATGSAITYAKRYIKNMIFNLQFREKDDDGNMAAGGQSGVLDERTHINHLENIRNAGSVAELKRLYLIAAAEASAIGDKNSTAAFEAAKNKRYKEL